MSLLRALDLFFSWFHFFTKPFPSTIDRGVLASFEVDGQVQIMHLY